MEPGNHKTLTPSLSGFALPLIVIVAVMGNLSPFSAASSWNEVLSSLIKGSDLSAESFQVPEILQRLAFYAPIGLLLHWRRTQRHRQSSKARTLLLVFLVVWMLELGQSLVPSRHPRISDAMVGMAAGALGVWLGAGLLRYRLTMHEFYQRYYKIILIFLVVLAGGVVAASVVISHMGVQLMGWDSGYPLLVANELTEDRPWQGRISGLAIYPRELKLPEITRLSQVPLNSDNLNLRRDLGAVACYFFKGVKRGFVRQQIAGQPPLDLLLPQPGPETWTPSDRGIDIKGPMLIRSDGTALTICNAIRASGEFAIEVEAAITDLSLHGPARIVSISRDPSLRNFTLGQESENLVFRVRTPRMGLNGAKVPCRTRSRPLTPGWHHLAASCGNGVLRLYVDGSEARDPLRLYGVAVLLFRGDWTGSTVLAAALLFFPLGYLASFCFMRRRIVSMLFLTLCVTIFPQLIVTWVLTESLGREQDFNFFAFAIVATLAGAARGRLKQLVSKVSSD